MKQNRFKAFWGMMRCIVLLAAAIPFAASAQTNASAMSDDRTSLDQQLQEALQERKEMESLLQTLEHTPGISDLQLETVRQRLARSDQVIEFLRKQEPQKRTARPLPYSRTERENTAVLPPPENVRSDLSVTTAAPDNSGEITLSIEGKIYGGVFVFEGNTIRFNNMIFYDWPEGITVDGKPWKDVTKPFELGYTPDFGKAGILGKDGPRMFYVDSADKRFTLRIENTNPGNHIAPFKVNLAMKNQIPHDDLAGYRPVPRKSHIQPMNDGAFYKVQAAKQAELWNDRGIKEHKIILSGCIQGSGTFVFEGNTIQYRHEDGKKPDTVTINGRRWTFLSEPFELPFEIETAHPEMTEDECESPVKLTQINDRKFEVYFNDPRPPSGTHSTVYGITIAPGGQTQSK